ncbi:MAG: hypothetical protein JST17_05255 [Bacteroidetes bacterium]|nr:hypothetical protein [Bacteroidota bacterium]
MKQKMLLPNKFKKIGWFILVPAMLLGIVLIIMDFETIQINATVFALYSDKILGKTQYFSFINTNIVNTLVGVLFIVGGLMVGFSREKNEDEYISNLRLNSLLWAVLVNYILLLFMFLFIYGLGFLNVMLYNMFTTLVIFIAKFNYSLFRNSKTVSNEE